MELNRVKEILSSPKEINVDYQGNPIWIEGIDEKSKIATVHARGSHDQKRQVSVDVLTEG